MAQVLTIDQMLAMCQKAETRKTGERVTAIYYGPSGRGKTTMIGTNETPIFIANFDPDGPDTLRGRKDIYWMNFYDTDQKSPKGMENFFKFMATGLKSGFFNKFKTVALDPTSGFEEAAMNYILWKENKLGQTPSLPNYNTCTRFTWQAIKVILSVEQCHSIVTCHEKPQKCEITGRVRVYPLLYGRTSNEIFRLFSEAYHLDSSGMANEVKFHAQVKADKLHNAKSRLDKTGKILDAYEKPDQQYIVNKIRQAEAKAK